ncbi:MAG: BatA domain-containing protein [Methanotrichaceae archaeon]|nr:BatA domain-containing protein [Methanotrichaceae archaeon]
MPFQNSLALLGLLSVVPLIIVYLIQPRPKEILFSSTMFLREGEAERSAVLSRLIKDPLFWVQLLVLISLSLAAAGPYTTTFGTIGSHLAIVLDASASMEANFHQATTLVSPYIDKYDSISIIIANSIPISALQSGSSSEAKDVLAKIAPRAISADISSAMILANNLLGSEGGDMLVVSDFISWTGDDPETTRKVLEGGGKVNIVFAGTNRGGDNVAIIGGWNVLGLNSVNHTALIQNFGPSKTVPIILSSQGGTSSRTISVPREGDYYFSFSAIPGLNQITLDVDDAIVSDNKAFVYVPELGERKVLYLGDDSPALIALKSLPNVRLFREGEYTDFDLIVLAKNGSRNGKLNRYIDAGGKVVHLASNTLESPDYLPVKVIGQSQGPANLWVRSTGFAKDIHFDEIGIFSYLNADPRRHSTTLIEANGTPILSYWQFGKGMIVYDGLEMDSDFYYRPEYPIFWYELVNWLTGVPDISQSNHKTGEVIPLGNAQEVETPRGLTSTSNLLLDEEGIYRVQDKILVANMYDPRESDLRDGASYPPGEFKAIAAKEAPIIKDLAPLFIALALIAIIAELALIKWRRET